MVGRFEGGGRATLGMTAGTTAGRHADMRKTCARPRGGTVTSIARFISGHVILRFTLGDVAVVALTALMRCYARVTEKSNLP